VSVHLLGPSAKSIVRDLGAIVVDDGERGLGFLAERGTAHVDGGFTLSV
jgi:hypothetical protein